jgi:hypothetical protein
MARKVPGPSLESTPPLLATNRFVLEYGIGSDRYRFVCGDLFETVKEFDAGSFDVVFCFGFFHMHNRHFEMLKQVESWNDLFDYQLGQRVSLTAGNLRYQK